MSTLFCSECMQYVSEPTYSHVQYGTCNVCGKYGECYSLSPIHVQVVTTHDTQSPFQLDENGKVNINGAIIYINTGCRHIHGLNIYEIQGLLMRILQRTYSRFHTQFSNYSDNGVMFCFQLQYQLPQSLIDKLMGDLGAIQQEIYMMIAQ